MKWIGRERSGNVEDRRGMARPVAGVGIVGIIIAVIYMFLGGTRVRGRHGAFE